MLNCAQDTDVFQAHEVDPSDELSGLRDCSGVLAIQADVIHALSRDESSYDSLLRAPAVFNETVQGFQGPPGNDVPRFLV